MLSRQVCGLMPVDRGIYIARNSFWHALGLIALMTYVFLKLSGVKLATFAEGLVVLLFLYALVSAPRAARTDPLVIYLFFAIAVSLITFLAVKAQTPIYAPEYPQLERLTKPFLIVVVAWWLGGNTTNVLRLYSVAFAGLIFAVLYNFDLASMQEAITPSGRVDYGLRNAGHTAAFFGVSLIGWIAFSNRMFAGARGVTLILKLLAWGAILLWLIWSIVMSQTRAAWLGLGLSVLAVTPFLYRKYGAFRSLAPKTRRNLVVAVILLLSACAIVFVSQGIPERIAARVTKEMGTVATAIDGDIDKVSMDSIGIRIHLWHEAAGWIAERPITGWGDSGPGAVITESERFTDEFKSRFGHIHNSIIEILLMNGVLGLALFTGLFLWIYYCLWRCWRSGSVPDSFFVFGVAFLVFWGTMNLFESYLIFWSGTYIDAIVLGGLYTYCLSNRQRVTDKLNHRES